MKNKILIVSIIYNEVLYESNTYRTLYHNLSDVFIIDNSEESPNKKVPLKESWIYLEQKNNPGISKSYNIAAEYAKRKGYNWILLTDQDTTFPPDAIDVYKSAIENNPRIKMFLPKVKIMIGEFMSPVKSTHYFSRLSHYSPSGRINPKKYAIINSGLCINVDAFFEAGGYNEKVWLDFADIQFIEKFAKKYDEAYVIDLECIQSFSNEGQNINQKINRFKLFCDSIKHYEPSNRLNIFWIFCVTLKRAVSLCKQSKSIKPLSILVKYYLS